MAKSVDFLNKRIAGKEAELDKLNKKLARIEKAEQSNWEVNPYYYSEYDKKQTLRDIENAEKSLDGYKKELEIAREKENSRNVQVIIDFLENWKSNVTEYYANGLEEAYDLLNEYKRQASIYNDCKYGTEEYYTAKVDMDNAHNEYYNKLHGYFRDYTDSEKQRAREMHKYPYGKVKVKDGELEYVLPYMSRNMEESMAKLKKDLDKDAIAMYDDIIERTNRIVGQITDVSYLEINPKGNLDGYIIGTKGKAKVETICAGGYNIQKFHFRTLIKPMK